MTLLHRNECGKMHNFLFNRFEEEKNSLVFVVNRRVGFVILKILHPVTRGCCFIGKVNFVVTYIYMYRIGKQSVIRGGRINRWTE